MVFDAVPVAVVPALPKCHNGLPEVAHPLVSKCHNEGLDVAHRGVRCGTSRGPLWHIEASGAHAARAPSACSVGKNSNKDLVFRSLIRTFAHRNKEKV